MTNAFIVLVLIIYIYTRKERNHCSSPGKPAGKIKSLMISGSQDNCISGKLEPWTLSVLDPCSSRKVCICMSSSNINLHVEPQLNGKSQRSDDQTTFSNQYTFT